MRGHDHIGYHNRILDTGSGRLELRIQGVLLSLLWRGSETHHLDHSQALTQTRHSDGVALVAAAQG